MTELERIGSLEHEIGRWKKRCADQQKQIDELREIADSVESLREIMDAILVQITLEHGEQVKSTDAFDGVEGYCLRYAMPNVEETLRKYMIGCTVADHGEVTVNVARRPEEDADGEE